jgi:putative SOS response-associated peptidase YedK
VDEDRQGRPPTIINARLETVASRPAFRDLVPDASRRALLLVADGWYQWQKPERPSEPRQPFWFRVDGGAPFAFAALWTQADVDGRRIQSTALLTCDSAPNPLAAAIHDRMPVVLHHTMIAEARCPED